MRNLYGRKSGKSIALNKQNTPVPQLMAVPLPVWLPDIFLHCFHYLEKFTFFNFEYDIPHPAEMDNSIFMPSLLDLAAMKAFALGMRSKWKDYMHLYFILKDHYNINQISEKANLYFGDLFSEKLFRGQLNYFKGISFEEQVEFFPGFDVNEEKVKKFLTDAALTGF